MFLRKNHRWLVVLCAFVVVVGTFFRSSLVTLAQDASLDSLTDDMRFLRENTAATLFFAVFGENPDPNFVKHHLSERQLKQICGEDCTGFGNNAGNYFGDEVEYDSMEEVGFDWLLQIARSENPGAVSSTINQVGSQYGVIVRFGVASDAGGFTTPQSLISFLNNVAGSTSVPFFAIAGPNEPDHEPWAHDDGSMLGKYGQACGTYSTGSTTWAPCVGERLADFMTQMCTAKQTGALASDVKLLTPAFNVTSPSFTPLMEALRENNAPFECFDGLAVNIYPAGKSVQDWWVEKGLDNFEIPIYVTETGPWNPVTDPVDPNAPPEPSDDGDDSTREGASNVNHYVSPILGLWPPAARNVTTIRESLVNQGYQAYCATPTYTIEPEFGGDIEDFIANVRAGFLPGREVDVDSQEVVNYSNANTPIFRDTERKYMLKSDLEEFFSYRELDQSRYSQTEMRSGAINSLLSEKQKCVKTVDTLYAQEEMCNKLIFEPDKNCALFTHQISGTDYTVLQLLSEYKGFAGTRDRVEACSEIVAQEGGKNNKFRYAMLNAPLSIEKAYRIAYLVGVIEQKPKTRSTLFNFFSHSEIAQPRDEVVVLTFKIPDIGTNKGSTWQTEQATDSSGDPLYERVVKDERGRKMEKVESGHTFWDDAMTLTRNVLIPRKMAEKLDIEGSKEREELRAAAEAATGQGAGSLVYCLNGQAPFGQGSATCNTEDVKAVTDIINGTWVHDKERISCDKLSFEQTNEIGDSARLGPLSHANNFQIKYGEKILQNIWSINQTAQPFQTVFQVYGDTWPPKDCNVGGQGEGSTGDCTTLTFYLVYPMGYDLDTLEYVMARTFLTEEQFEVFSKDPDIKERFNIFGDQRQLNAEEATEEFRDCLHVEIDEFGRAYCPEKEFTATLTSSQGPALFYGARLGYWTHEIQKTFHRLESLAHKYLRNCRTTEEFLLDQCGGVASEEEFDAKSYCANRTDKAKIIRDVDETQLDRFRFFKEYYGPKHPESVRNIQLPDEQNSILARPGEASCKLNMSARAVDSLTLILSGGIDIIPNNPGNILSCTGTVSMAKKVKIKRLPPEFGHKPTPNDPAWEKAETMITGGSSASEISYEIDLRPGYYLVDFNLDNTLCQSDKVWVMQDGETIGEDEGYVIDFTDPAQCEAQACVDFNMQTAMSGGGPVYKTDEEGNTVIDYVIDVANEWHNDAFGCPLSFDYSTLKYNNTCGGRLVSCNDPEVGGNCGFWSDLIDDIRNSSDEIMKKGRDAYYAVYGRLPKSSGDMSCVDKSQGDPIFGNTIVVHNCDSYSNVLDSLRIFQKIIGFKINWFSPDDQSEKKFVIPSPELWGEIKKASDRHGCDPWLVLALASSEGEDEGYRNDTIPDDELRLGIFQITKERWDRWISPNQQAAPQCSWHQPKTFNESIVAGKIASDIPAAMDTACRISLHSGIQKYPEDFEAFKTAFLGSFRENASGEGWAQNESQARYVWEFWKKAREAAEEPPKAQPADFPYPLCGGLDTPPIPGQPQPPPPGNADPIATSHQLDSTAHPQYLSEFDRQHKGDADTALRKRLRDELIAKWMDFTNYFEATKLPATGLMTYQRYSAQNETLQNRYRWGEITGDFLKNCEYLLSGTSQAEMWETRKAQGANNGSSQAVGCGALLRMGDIYFRGADAETNKVRLVWIKTDSGYFSTEPFGPVAVIDVGAQHDLSGIHERQKGEFIFDLDYWSFRMLHDHDAGWSRPQQVTVCETREQCL